VARVLCRLYESASVCGGGERSEEGRLASQGLAVIASFCIRRPWTEERKRMPRRGSRLTRGCGCVRLLAGCVSDWLRWF
jgi:hypothetical protein